MMDIKEIMSVIPHRPPFLLIDKILEFEPGKKITAIKNVTMNEPFFTGHFPGKPVMPGVLLVEAMAQAGAVILLSLEQFKGKIAYFGAINKAKFRGMVVPGDTLKIDVEITKIRKSAGIGMGIAYVGEKKVAEGELTFMIQ